MMSFDESYKHHPASLVMDNNFELLESFVSKKINRFDFRQKLTALGFSVVDQGLIEEFANTLIGGCCDIK